MPEKLIDGQALGIALHAAWVEEHSSYLKDAVWRVRRKLDELPDASLSLREELAQKDARIKELEAGLGRLLSASKDVYDDSYGVNGEAYTIASKEAEILLDGGVEDE